MSLPRHAIPAEVECAAGPASSTAARVFVVTYIVLLLVIPTRLIVEPVGAPGSPAGLFATVGLLWWVLALVGGRLTEFRAGSFRTAAGLFAAAVLASYGAGHLQGWYQPADIRPRYGATLWRVAIVPEMTEVATSAADRGLLALAAWLGIAMVTAEGLRSWADVERVLSWLAGIGTLVAAFGVLQYFTGLNVAELIRIPGLSAERSFGEALTRSDLNRIVSTSTHPIELGVVMASLLPIALHVGFRARRPVGWLPSLTIGAATLMTVSRSAIVVAAVVLIVLLAGWPLRRRIVLLGALPILALVGPMVLPGLLGTIRSLFSNFSDDPSIAGRTDDYTLVMREFVAQPLFGRGLFTWVPMVYRTLDNQVLVLALELGAVGLIAFLGLGALGVTQGALLVRSRSGDPDRRDAGLAIAASIAGILTSYLTFDALGFRQVAGLTFLYLGLAGAAWNLTKADRDGPRCPGSAGDVRPEGDVSR